MELINRLVELERDLRRGTHNLIVSNYLELDDVAEIIETMRKQIPQKPAKEYEHDGDLDYNFVCPSCGRLLDPMFQLHHCKCHQCIDWSIDEKE